MTEAHPWDYVVVGGGSAGCVVAGRLAEDPAVRVLLLEAGDRAEDHPETLEADGYKRCFANDALFHERFTVPQPGARRHRLFAGTGRGLGGSGSVNGMVYTRGAIQDFEEWPAGWRWSDVAGPYEALEARLRVRPRTPTRFTEAFVEAATGAGFRRSEDLNSGDLSGVLGYETMNYEGDARRSSYVAFVQGGRPGLDVRTGATVHRVRLSEGRAVGVEYAHGGADHFAAARQVVLCAGALATPKLLLLSGVGPAEHLRAHGITPAVDLPAVGAGLHDHPNVTLFFSGREDVDSSYPQLYGFHRAHEGSSLPPGQADTCYVAWPARSALREATLRLVPGMVLPQPLYRVPALRQGLRGLISLAFRLPWLQRFVRRLWGVVVILGKPHSRGSLRLASAAPAAPALVDPAYFTDPGGEDLATMVRGVQLARRLAAGDPLTPWRSRELAPGPRRAARQAKLEAWIRGAAMTTYHFAGTCRMGEDEASVVDPQLRVRGVEGLRVADASVVPWTPVSAMNAPSMMVGWRAVELLRSGG